MCSRCHDHKYDPILQDDFYSFFAFFNQVPEKGLSGFDPRERIESPLSAQRLAAIDVDIAAAEKQVSELIQRYRWSPRKAEARFLEELKEEWRPVEFTALRSAGGATLRELEDGSVLVSGKNPDKDTYDLRFVAAVREFTRIRLELLPDPDSLTRSAARGAGGIAQLNQFVVTEAAEGIAAQDDDYR